MKIIFVQMRTACFYRNGNNLMEYKHFEMYSLPYSVSKNIFVKIHLPVALEFYKLPNMGLRWLN